MFFATDQNAHGLAFDPLKALVVPRPIGWIATRSTQGQLNLAPYSFFNLIHDEPALVLFSSGGPKDSATFAQETGEFVVNLVTEHLALQMNQTAVDAPRGASEFDYAGVTPAASRLVAPPRVEEAYAALECRVTQVFSPKQLDGRDASAIVVIGQVVGVYIDERILEGDRINITRARPVARLGYSEFATVSESFSMKRPKWPSG